MGGNTSKKLAAKCSMLTKEEQKHIAATFRSASRNTEKIREEDITVSGCIDAEFIDRLWSQMIDPRLSRYLMNYLFTNEKGEAMSNCDFNTFASLYVHNIRGTVDDRVTTWYRCLGKEYSDSTEVPYQVLQELCQSLTSTYMKIIRSSSSERTVQWINKGFRSKPQNVQALGDAITAHVSDDGEPISHVTTRMMDRWLSTDMLLKNMTECVFMNLYGVYNNTDENNMPIAAMPSLLPKPEGIESMPDVPTFLDLCHIIWLNQSLPSKHKHKWRFLYSTKVHGQSFSTLSGRIIDQGPSLVIVEDLNGYIFGGFADTAWVVGPNWVGSEESFLFTLAPKMCQYSSSGFNDHYQYMNINTKTLPNGLLMGGQFEFGGLWIIADPFGQGSSAETCITYRGYKRLSKEEKFRIKALEVWGVGEKPLSVKDSNERSILDRNPEARAILELAGKTRYSDGVREPEND